MRFGAMVGLERGAIHAGLADPATCHDCLDAGRVRHGARTRPIAEGLAVGRLLCRTAGAARAAHAGPARGTGTLGAAMALIAGKIALAIVAMALTLGVFPDRLRGGLIAIATCIAAALALHFA